MATGGFNTDMHSDETFDLLCTVCKNNGMNTEAVKYCTDCTDYYCLTCVKVHDDIPLLKGHKIIDQGRAKAGTRKQLPVVPTERCVRHGHKPVDMYCQNHDIVGCAACMAAQHRPCQHIYYIPELIQTDKTKSTAPSTKKKLECTEQALKRKLKNLQQEKQNVLKRRAESIENVRKFRGEVSKRLDEMERNSIAEVEDKYKAVIQQIDEYIRVLEDNKEDVTSVRDTLVSAGTNVSQVFVSTKKGIAAASKAAKSLNITKAGNQTEEIIFTADLKLSELLEETNSLGQVTLKYKGNPELGSAQQVKQMDTLLQTKGISSYSVKFPSDTDVCAIISLCFLEDGTVILADSSNEKLKRLDTCDYSIRDYYDLPGQPWQVCSINNQEVAVSIRSMLEILFITNGSKMAKRSSIKVHFYCRGLAHAGNNLYISGRKNVFMYTLSGQLLKQFRLDMLGLSFFYSLTYDFFGRAYGIYRIAVSKDDSKIYVAAGIHGLIVLDNTGTVIKKFDDPVLKTAYDCSVTDSGSVLVCGFESNNVLQFTPDGELIGKVVKSDGCRSVCCNQQMSKMIVGKVQNEIEVNDLV